MTRFVDRHVDLDAEAERRRRALESMDWVERDDDEEPVEPEPLDDEPLVVHTVSEDDPPG